MLPKMRLGVLALLWWTGSSVEEEECREGVVSVDYADLVSDDPSVRSRVAEAYGLDGLGILAVTGVPEELLAARRELLVVGRRLARLDEAALSAFESPEHSYVVGWSRGRERFRGKIDHAKGSFYANGLYADAALNETQEVLAKYPFAAAEPEWPQVDDFKGKFRRLSRQLYDLSEHVLRHCDAIIDDASMTRKHSLVELTHQRSRLHVGRLLHYYSKEHEDDDDWCGMHNDNSVITALVPGMYFDSDSGEESNMECADLGGLEALSRKSRTRTRVRAPKDAVLFQLGEAAQIFSGGVLVATPHAVAAPQCDSPLERTSFALFVEPHWSEPLEPPVGVPLADVLFDDGGEIPPLAKRLPKVPVEFGTFLADSAREYY